MLRLLQCAFLYDELDQVKELGTIADSNHYLMHSGVVRFGDFAQAALTPALDASSAPPPAPMVSFLFIFLFYKHNFVFDLAFVCVAFVSLLLNGS